MPSFIHRQQPTQQADPDVTPSKAAATSTLIPPQYAPSLRLFNSRCLRLLPPPSHRAAAAARKPPLPRLQRQQPTLSRQWLSPWRAETSDLDPGPVRDCWPSRTASPLLQHSHPTPLLSHRHPLSGPHCPLHGHSLAEGPTPTPTPPHTPTHTPIVLTHALTHLTPGPPPHQMPTTLQLQLQQERRSSHTQQLPTSHSARATSLHTPHSQPPAHTTLSQPVSSPNLRPRPTRTPSQTPTPPAHRSIGTQSRPRFYSSPHPPSASTAPGAAPPPPSAPPRALSRGMRCTQAWHSSHASPPSRHPRPCHSCRALRAGGRLGSGGRASQPGLHPRS